MCQNPWAYKKCSNADLAVFIVYKGEQLSICHKCWNKLADSDHEWGKDEWVLPEFKENEEKNAV